MRERETERDRERQRDRETERQRDRETGRQRDREMTEETERHRDIHFLIVSQLFNSYCKKIIFYMFFEFLFN